MFVGRVAKLSDGRKKNVSEGNVFASVSKSSAGFVITVKSL